MTLLISITEHSISVDCTVIVLVPVFRVSDTLLEGRLKSAACFRGYAGTGPNASGVWVTKDAVTE